MLRKCLWKYCHKLSEEMLRKSLWKCFQKSGEEMLRNPVERDFLKNGSQNDHFTFKREMCEYHHHARNFVLSKNQTTNSAEYNSKVVICESYEK